MFACQPKTMFVDYAMFAAVTNDGDYMCISYMNVHTNKSMVVIKANLSFYDKKLSIFSFIFCFKCFSLSLLLSLRTFIGLFSFRVAFVWSFSVGCRERERHRGDHVEDKGEIWNNSLVFRCYCRVCCWKKVEKLQKCHAMCNIWN